MFWKRESVGHWWNICRMSKSVGLQVPSQALQGSFRATPPLTPVRVNRVKQGLWVLGISGLGLGVSASAK